MQRERILGVGILGTGFIARAFAMAFTAAPQILDLGVDVRLRAVGSHNKERAELFAQRFDVERCWMDWRQLVNDEAIDLILIGTQDHLHFEQAMATLAVNKHLLCEKPIAMTLSECERLYAVTQGKSCRHAVGFTYLANPLMPLIQELIQDGTLGEIYSFSGFANEDALGDPQAPYTWRSDDQLACYGTSADLGYHFLAQLLYLLGDPAEVIACREIGVKERPDENGRMRTVTTDGVINGIIRYANGISGNFQASKLCTGRKLYHRMEIHGSQGAILIDLEDINACKVYLREESRRLAGYRRIMAGKAHYPYECFCPADGHGLGFNDFVTIQAGALIRAIFDTKQQPIADLGFGLRVHRVLDALVRSSDTEEWMSCQTERDQGVGT